MRRKARSKAWFVAVGLWAFVPNLVFGQTGPTPEPGKGEPRKADTNEPPSMTPSAVKPKLHHFHQVGVELSFGGGYRLIKPYGDPWCGEREDGDNKTFCDSAVPVFMEAGLSFGILRFMDLIADFRFGLMKDKISDRRPLTLLAGVRFWIDAAKPFKIGVGLQVMMDFTKQNSDSQSQYGAPDQDKLDVGGRVYAEFHYDFLRYLGIFGRLGGTLGALRWIRLELEASAGVQARFP